VLAGTAAVEGREREAAQAPPQRVLIVEDELLVAMELAAGLADEGWSIVGPAGSVEEAFKLVSEEGNLAAAILDINLNGQLAYPIADLLQTRGVPYLFCTGYETPTDDDRYRTATVVQKPASFNVILSELKRLVPGPLDPLTCEAA